MSEPLNEAIEAAEAAMIAKLSRVVYEDAVGQPVKGSVESAKYLLGVWAADRYRTKGDAPAQQVVVQLPQPLSQEQYAAKYSAIDTSPVVPGPHSG